MQPPLRRLGALLPMLALSSLAACAGTQRARATPAMTTSRGPIQGEGFRVIAAGATREGDAYDASLLFDRAVAAMRAERCDDALRDLDTLIREFPETRYVFAAEYNRGLCMQRARRWDDAAAALRRAAQDTVDPSIVRDALFRLAVVGELAARPELVLDATERLLNGARRTLPEQVEAHARRSVALLSLRRLDDAAAAAERAIAIAPNREAISALGDDTYAAMARTALAEVTRTRASEVAVRVEGDDGGATAIRDRTRLVLRAHALFNDALHVGNPEWQAVAGFRIGEMYRDLYRAIVDAPLPAEWDPPARAIYRRRAAEQLRRLLSSALTIWELTRAMARREAIQSNAWVRRTEEAIEELRTFVTGATQPAPAPPRRTTTPSPVPSTVRPAG